MNRVYFDVRKVENLDENFKPLLSRTSLFVNVDSISARLIEVNSKEEVLEILNDKEGLIDMLNENLSGVESEEVLSILEYTEGYSWGTHCFDIDKNEIDLY